MLNFKSDDSLKSMDLSIRDNAKDIEYWGDLDISKDNLDTLKNRIVVLLERNVTFKELFKQFPYAMVSYVVFLAKYQYKGDFWGMVSEEIGIKKPNAPDQTQIGKLILKVFNSCGLDYSPVMESTRKYVDAILYEIGVPPESNFSDIFYIFKYGLMSNSEPQILIDEITSREYGVHKPMLHFLVSAPEERAINFILDIQDTYIAATQTDDFSNKYSGAYTEWVEQDKLKTTYRGKNSDDQVEVRPYFYFDNGKKGLCIVLPRQNITEEWVECAQWTVIGDDNFQIDKECFVQEKERKRFIDQIVVPVKPCRSYTLNFEYNDGFETYPKTYELTGIEENDFFYFNSNGRKINQRYLRSPYGIIVYPSNDSIISNNIDRTKQAYPLLSNNYRVEQITPLSIDAQFTIITEKENIVLQMRPQVITSLAGKRLFNSEFMESEMPLFTEIPKLILNFEGFNTEEGIELRIGRTILTVEGLSLDEDNVVDISSGFNEKSYGIYSIRIYQFNRFIKQVRFCLIPEFKTNYTNALTWVGYENNFKSDSAKLSIDKVDEWHIDFTNGNVQNLPDKYEVCIPYKAGVLNGTIISQQEDLHLAIGFELPISAYKAELISNNEISERCDLADFLDGNPWLSLSFYGRYKENNYFAELVSANGVEQKEEIKLTNNGSVNFDLNVFRDTIQLVPLPVKIRITSIESSESFNVLLIDEVVKFKYRPQYSRKNKSIAIKDEDIRQNAILEKYGDPNFRLILDYGESEVNEKGIRHFPISEDISLTSGYYRIVRENNANDWFVLNDDFEVTLQTDQFYISLHDPDEIITNFSEWIDQFIGDLIKNRSIKKIDNLKQSDSYRFKNNISKFCNDGLSDNDIENLVLLGNIFEGKIPNAHKAIIAEIMVVISELILSNEDRYRVLEQLVKTNANELVFNLCKRNYSLLLFEFPDDVPVKHIQELAGAIKPISVLFSLQILMKGNVPIKETFGNSIYRDSIGQDAFVEMLNSNEPIARKNEDRKHFLREDGLSHVNIALNSEISGINNFIEMADKKKFRTGRIYLDKKKIPEVGFYFAGTRYTDLFVNWYIRNHLGDAPNNSDIRIRMQNAYETFKNSVWDKSLSFNKNKDVSFFFKEFNNVLMERAFHKDDLSGSISSTLAYPTFFYFEGIAALIAQLDEFKEFPEVRKEANRFMVKAFQIAPFISERDVLMSSMYIYLKRKENR